MIIKVNEKLNFASLEEFINWLHNINADRIEIEAGSEFWVICSCNEWMTDSIFDLKVEIEDLFGNNEELEVAMTAFNLTEVTL